MATTYLNLNGYYTGFFNEYLIQTVNKVNTDNRLKILENGKIRKLDVTTYVHVLGWDVMGELYQQFLYSMLCSENKFFDSRVHNGVFELKKDWDLTKPVHQKDLEASLSYLTYREYYYHIGLNRMSRYQENNRIFPNYLYALDSERDWKSEEFENDNKSKITAMALRAVDEAYYIITRETCNIHLLSRAYYIQEMDKFFSKINYEIPDLSNNTIDVSTALLFRGYCHLMWQEVRDILVKQMKEKMTYLLIPNSLMSYFDMEQLHTEWGTNIIIDPVNLNENYEEWLLEREV